METPYTKRELDNHFTNVKELFIEHQRDDQINFGEIKEILRDLTEEVKKTNGRVKALEGYRWFLTGGLSVLSLIMVPILIYLVTNASV